VSETNQDYREMRAAFNTMACEVGKLAEQIQRVEFILIGDGTTRGIEDVVWDTERDIAKLADRIERKLKKKKKGKR
jgi:hypothetical protein